MTTVTLTTTHLSPPEGGWTADDLAAFPDDGLRYELVDGVLLVSAAPSEEHQIALSNLFVLLHATAPPELRVFFAPYDVRFSARRQLQPDVVVLPKDRTAPDRLPLLVVEVASPSTRATDSTLKRLVFEQAGVPSYWMVDPLHPALTILELQDGGYVQVAAVEGDEPVTLQRPFPVTLTPSDLLR
jgi:Uma2 family endonuclease